MSESRMSDEKFHKYFLTFVGVSYIVAGVPHFTSPEFYLPMMPPYLPAHMELIYISGFFEIIGGIGLLIPQLRRYAAWGLLALLVAVFPANIHLVANDVQLTDAPNNPVLMWIRLPFQAVFMYMVWWSGLKEHAWQKESSGQS